jgi:uncharacterized protein YukE
VTSELAERILEKDLRADGTVSHIVTLLLQNVLHSSYAPNSPDTKGRSTGCAGADTGRRRFEPGEARLAEQRDGRSRATLFTASGKGRPIVPNVNITHAEMQSAVGQLQAGEQMIEGDLGKLKLVDNIMTSRCVTDTSSRHFHGSYTQFSLSATRMIQGLNGMAQYLDTAVKAFGDTDAQLASLGQ